VAEQWVSSKQKERCLRFYLVAVSLNGRISLTAGVISFDNSPKQTVLLDVMPLQSGFLPLPRVRLSKYFPADQKLQTKGLEESVISALSFSFTHPFTGTGGVILLIQAKRNKLKRPCSAC